MFYLSNFRRRMSTVFAVLVLQCGVRRSGAMRKIVIAEINKSFIRTFGDNYIHVSEIDYFVEQTTEKAAAGSDQLGRKAPEIGKEEKNIAGYVGS